MGITVLRLFRVALHWVFCQLQVLLCQEACSVFCSCSSFCLAQMFWFWWNTVLFHRYIGCRPSVLKQWVESVYAIKLNLMMGNWCRLNASIAITLAIWQINFEQFLFAVLPVMSLKKIKLNKNVFRLDRVMTLGRSSLNALITFMSPMSQPLLQLLTVLANGPNQHV